jgi:hypothetical protein
MYIKPFFGLDFAHLENNFGDPNPINEFLKKGLSSESVLAGTGIELFFHNKYSISIQSSYMIKKVDVHSANFIPHSGVKFQCLQSNLFANRKLFDLFSAGIGLGCNRYMDFYLIYRENKEEHINSSVTELNLIVKASIHWRNFNFCGYYLHGIKSKSYGNLLFIEFRPSRSIGVTLGYDIKIFDKGKRGKRVDCPKV